MKYKFIGYPMKDGCHVNGADKGINILDEYIALDKKIDIIEDKDDINNIKDSSLLLAKCVNEYKKDSFIPVTLGGDHSLAIGSIAGASSDDIGVIWFDTHPDCNTNKTTVTFNIHGYPLASSLGDGQDEFTKLYNNKTKVKYENVVLFGIDDIDNPEEEYINKHNIKNFTLKNLYENGIENSINETIDYLKNKVSQIHLSFDIDVINYNECPGVNVPNQKKNGITKDEAIHIFKSFIDRLNITSIDIVEYNPINDIDNKSLNIVLDSIEYLKSKK